MSLILQDGTKNILYSISEEQTFQTTEQNLLLTFKSQLLSHCKERAACSSLAELKVSSFSLREAPSNEAFTAEVKKGVLHLLD